MATILDSPKIPASPELPEGSTSLFSSFDVPTGTSPSDKKTSESLLEDSDEGEVLRKSSKKNTVSIIIPVYNEEDYIGACLDSIASQSEKPNEVIVVDNNSTDNTKNISRRYSFVTLISEERQHQSFAQITGFDHANSTILVRTDADAILPKDYVARVKKSFDEGVVAVTGSGRPYDVALKKLGAWIFITYHERLASLIAGHAMLWGSNMAITEESWKQIKSEVHRRKDIWEDYDISFHLAPKGVLLFIEDLSVGCSYRSAHKSFVRQINYQFQSIRTFYLHTSLARTILFGLVWSTLILVFPVTIIDNILRRLNK